MDPRTLRDIPTGDLKTQITDLERELGMLAKSVSEIEAQLAPIRAEIGRKTQHLNAIRDEIERRNRPAPVPRVSDHALLRYLERVKDVDIEAARAEILTPAVTAAIIQGASGVIVGKVKFVVSGATITTTLGEEQRPKHTDFKRGKVVDAKAEVRREIDNYYAEGQSA